MWFIYWLLFIFGGSYLTFEMGKGNWILSAVLLGSVFIALIIYEIYTEPKDIIKKILSAAIGFVIVFSALAFVSHEDPTFVEDQVDYITNNQ